MLLCRTGFVRLIAWAVVCPLALLAQAPPVLKATDASPAPQVANPAPPPPDLPRSAVTSLHTGFDRYAGRRVRDIQIRSATPNPEQMLALIAQKVNEPLDRGKVRRSIRALYATGKFADIQVEAQQQDPTDVTLVFVARENYFVGDVTVVNAPKRPTQTQLVNASKLQLGELFSREKVDAAVENMKLLLADNGYHRATVTPNFTYHHDQQLVDTEFRIERGELARIGRVHVTGNPGFNPGEIEDIAKLYPGDEVSRKRLDGALQRLQKRYQKRGRLEAQIAVAGRQYHPETNTVDYTFEIQRGPTVDVHMEGAKLSKGKVRRYVPIYQEHAVDDDLLNEGRRNIRDYYQTKGFFDVDVDVEQHYVPSEDHRHVEYRVDLGERHKLVAVDLEGNRYFDGATLRERMVIEPASGLLFHGRFSQSLLTRDVAAIKALYQANGFEKVEVRPQVVDDYQGKSGELRVVLHVDEGPQTLVGNFSIDGNNAYTVDELRSERLINTTPGQPFSESTMAADRDQIVTFYYNHGFPNVEMQYFSERAADGAMNVRYRIHEGEQFFVDRVLVTGLRYTKPFVVSRELQVQTRDPLSQVEMLTTQQRLYDLGIFNAVDVAVQNPEGEERDKDVIVQVEEAKRYTFTYGLGLEVATGESPDRNAPEGRTGVSPRVSFEVTRLNFRGRDHTIVFKARVGRLQRRGLLSYEAPRWFDRENLKLTFNVFYDNTRDVHTFTAERLEGSVVAQHTITRATSLLYRFAYRRVRVDASSLAIDPNLIPLFSRPVRVGMPSITWIRDTRDDPIESHRGTFNTVDIGVSSNIFGSESNFSRLLFQNSTYFQFGKNPKRRYVLARSTRIGVEHPFGGLAEDFVPLPERFFGGGGNSHRGFSINQAGPRDRSSGFPIGGNALWLNNVELRMPPLRLPLVDDNASPVIFWDMGNVYSSARAMVRHAFDFRQNKRSCENLTLNGVCDLDFASHAVGAGLRYKTPIGPVRVDLGYNLNPPVYPNRSAGRVDTLRRFNFFFSIGQTF